MNIFFKSDENFDKIIADTLKGKKIVKANQITTGWTNIVYEVETDNGNYLFRFPRDEFWSRTIVKDCEFAGYIYNKTDFNTSKLELKYYNGKPFSVHKKIKGTPLAKKMDSLSDKDRKCIYAMHKYELGYVCLKNGDKIQGIMYCKAILKSPKACRLALKKTILKIVQICKR